MTADPDSKVQCHDCRRTFPTNQATVRTVRVSTSKGGAVGVGSGGLFGAVGKGGNFSKVDLCIPCAKRRDERDRLANLQAWVSSGIAGTGTLIGLVTELYWFIPCAILVGAIAFVVIAAQKPPIPGEPD